MKEVIIKVDGMSCTGCENRIKNSLKDIDGVEKIEANYLDGTVKITLNHEVDKNNLKEKIEDLGFDVKED